MFRFVELSLHGWDLWPPVRVPLGSDVVVVTGPNGSGKTTLLDAIRQLLNAKGLSSRRRVQNYLRRPDAHALIRAVVSNDARDGAAQPFRAERITTAEATLACVLMPGSGGSPEKRFAILPGRATVEEVRRVLLDSRQWYPPEQYARALEGAGVTRSLMGILAIEQGRTNTLFERKPRELFREVLEMLGDRAVLERYRLARGRYSETQREVAEQTQTLLARQAELARVRDEVARLEQWERERERVRELERRLPATQLQRILKRQKELGPAAAGLRTKISRGEAEAGIQSARLGRARELEALAEDRLSAARAAEQEARAKLDAASREQAVAAALVAQLVGKADEAKRLPEGDLPALEGELNESTRALVLCSETVRATRERLEQLEERARRLREGLPVYPEAVTRAVAALAAQGVEVAVLAATVEIADEHLAAAAEAALGDARHALLVRPADAEAARTVARREGAPGPVYAGPRLDTSVRAGPLELQPGAPEWVSGWLARVALDADGAWQDERGTWLRPAADRVLGEHGRKVALAQAERDRDEAAAKAAEASGDEARAAARASAAAAAHETERRRQELMAAAAGLDAARVSVEAASERLQRTWRAVEEQVALRDGLTGDLKEASLASRDAERDLTELRTRLVGERKGLEEAEAEARENESRVEELSRSVDPELRLRAERGELVDGEDSVRAEFERAQRSFALRGEPPPAEVREEEKHLADNVAELDRHLAARRAEADAARAELDECRLRYLGIVSGALDDYRRRAKDLAERAQVKLEMDLPHLATLDGDRGLDEAEIRPSFGFDGKEPLPLGDPSFSGGQQVIAGLILLMAMAETERRGFFILDEPFAHLSLDRVDQVGRFLRSTQSQFIITAPTTLDRAQLDPASLVLVLRKKRPDEPFAPVPIVAQA
jgi:chromosome segregation ATPase